MLMRTLTIRHVPVEMATRLKNLAAQAELPLNTFVLQKLTEASRRADNAYLFNALPSLPIERASILEALAESRAEPGSTAVQDQNWVDFFLNSPAVSGAFLPERASQEQVRREAL